MHKLNGNAQIISLIYLLFLQYKLGKVKRVGVGKNSVPYIVTHDARTIRYPDPDIKVNDTVVIDIKTGKITDSIKFDSGNTVMVIGGRNTGRVGIITNREKHASEFFAYLFSQYDFRKKVINPCCTMLLIYYLSHRI